MTERKWEAVPPQTITANGGTDGQISVSDSSLFKVKQRVTLFSDSTSPIEYIVNKIPSPTLLLLGHVGKEIYKYANVSIFLTADNAKISALEQNRPTITPHDFQRAAYEEEPTMAHRSVLVDKYGRRIDQANPLPTTATLSVGSLTVETSLDSFTKNPPDNTIAVGTEDGTKTGTKHAVRVDSELDLRVGISDGANKAQVDGTGKLSVKDADAALILNSIVTALGNVISVDDDQTQTILNSIGVLLSGTLDVNDASSQVILQNILTALGNPLNVTDSQLATLITASNTILTSINTQLTTGVTKVDDDQTQTILNSILTQLQAGGLAIGTENGQISGVPHVFVNNLRQMIMDSHDRVGTITWLDIADKKNRRVDKLEFTSATFPSVTVRKQFSYTLVSGDYVRTSPGTWSII